MALLLPLDVGLLAHHPDRLVCSLDLNWLDVTDRHTINHCSLCLFGLLALNLDFLCSNGLSGEVTSSTGVSKAFLDTLGLSHGRVSLHDVLSLELLGGLVRDPLELLVLHLPCDRLSGIVGHGIILVPQKLLLDWLNRIIDSVTARRERNVKILNKMWKV